MPMTPEVADLYRSVAQTNEMIGKALSSLNDAPSSIVVPTTAKELVKSGDGVTGEQTGVSDVIRRRVIAAEKMDEIRSSLHGKSVRELNAIFAKQAQRRDTGVPLYEWLYSGGTPVQARFGGVDGMPGLQAEVAPDIAKAIDTNGASALIRQDLEPIIYELFVKQFPLWDQIPHEPANGLVHAYNQMLSFGEADFIGELDSVTDDKGTYHRAFTNVAILATRRGVSLKSQFAVMAGGMNYNPERLELTAGLRAMAKTYQKGILQGNWTDNAGTSANELGAFDEDAFDGLRKTLNTSDAVNVDPATNPDTTGNIRRAVDAAIVPVSDAGGGDGNLIVWGDTREQVTYDEQQDAKLRILQTAAEQDVNVGVRATFMQTVLGRLPFMGIRGQAVGEYVSSEYGGNTVRDLYILDMDRLSVPYLGSEGPTVLEIPIGVTGQLTHLFVIFFMGGLAIKAPTFMNKVRVKA